MCRFPCKTTRISSYFDWIGPETCCRKVESINEFDWSTFFDYYLSSWTENSERSSKVTLAKNQCRNMNQWDSAKRPLKGHCHFPRSLFFCLIRSCMVQTLAPFGGWKKKWGTVLSLMDGGPFFSNEIKDEDSGGWIETGICRRSR